MYDAYSLINICLKMFDYECVELYVERFKRTLTR